MSLLSIKIRAHQCHPWLISCRSYTIQASTNLHDWTDLQTILAPDQTVVITNMLNPADPRRFFRLRSP